MADEQLSAATRNYVIFGALVIVALALAAREWFGPQTGRGEPDRANRMLIVGGAERIADELDEVDGFTVVRLDHEAVVEAGRELLDDEDAPAYAAAVAFADQNGCGFAALSRVDVAGRPLDWQLDADALDLDAALLDSPFVVFSVGDLAPEGSRAHAVELAPVNYDAPLHQLDSLRLGLYGHPDLRGLWEREPSVVLLQGREVLRNRGLLDRHASIRADHDQWRELAAIWPEPGVIPGSLAGPREQVRAAPVHGGVLLEVRSLEIWISVFRRARLNVDGRASLWFVPFAALAADASDRVAARQRCEGLPDSFEGDISIAPDGSAVVLREHEHAPAQVFAFDEAAARAGRCVASLRGEWDLGERMLGRVHAAGKLAWYDQDEAFGTGGGEQRSRDAIEWFDAIGARTASVPGVYGYSGPWWADESLLVMVAALNPEVGPMPVLLDTGVGDPQPRMIDLRSLLPGHDTDEQAEIIDLRPLPNDELLLLTEHCPETPMDQSRPCLYRLHSEVPLRTLGGELDAEVLSLESLGSLGPHHALAIAADGSRALWIGDERSLMATDLLESTLAPQRVDADALPDAEPRISADGRVVISSVMLSLGELGEVSLARAFVLPAATRGAVPGPAPAGEVD